MHNWYREIPASEQISQGDILTDCPIVISAPQIDFDSEYYVGEVHNLVDLADVIVLTQACDLEDQSVNSVIVALLRDPVTMTISNEHKSPKEERGMRVDLFNKVHAGRIPNYALLPEHIGNITMNYKYVDFSVIYTVPLGFLMDFREIHGTRLRLNVPHRELLNQKFGYFFSRIGIPNDDHIHRDQVVNKLFPKTE